MELHPNCIDLRGRRFGRLVVVAYAGSRRVGRKKNKDGKWSTASFWECQCDCGNSAVVKGHNLKCGEKGLSGTKSCGCLLAETRKRNGRTMFDKRPKLFGKEHHSWKPELSDEQRKNIRRIDGYSSWRRSVMIRDQWKCQVCEAKGNLHAHHLVSYMYNPERRHDLDNGVAMCRPCHIDFHKVYGKRNFSRENFLEYQELNRPCGSHHPTAHGQRRPARQPRAPGIQASLRSRSTPGR